MKDSARALEVRLRGGTARMVRGGVHNWPLVQPELFVRVLPAWLTGARLPAELIAVVGHQPVRPRPDL